MTTVLFYAVARYRWVDFGLDRAAYRELAARGESSLARWAWSLVSAPKVYSVFSWSDPWPFLRLMGTRVRRVGSGRRALSKLRNLFSKAS